MQRLRQPRQRKMIDPSGAAEPQSEQSELMSLIGGIEQQWQAKVDQIQKQLEVKQTQLEDYAKRLEQADEILKYFDPEFSFRRAFKCKDDETARYICALANMWDADPDDLVTYNLKRLKENRMFDWRVRVAIKGH